VFLNPLMLAAVGGAVVPLVLHLLSRARYRSVDWGAMMFLQGAEARQRKSARLKQLLLLLMRMAMVALLAVALARPVVRQSWGGLAREGRVTAAILLDESGSMGFEENGRSRMQLAREAVLQILSTLKKGDQVLLLPMGGTVGGSGLASQDGNPPTSDLQAVAGEVDEAQAGSGEANAAEALTRAADLLDVYEPSNREIYVVTDRQALTWRDAGDAFARTWRQRLEKQERGRSATRVVVVPVGSNDAENVAVEEVRLLNPPAIVGESAEVEVRVRNYGKQARAGLPLTVSSGRGKGFETTMTLGPGAGESVRVPVKFETPGSQVVTAEVHSAGLVSDDNRQSAIDVTPPVRVLILSGDERPPGTKDAGAKHKTMTFRSESDFLSLALAPFKAMGRPGPNVGDVTVMEATRWGHPAKGGEGRGAAGTNPPEDVELGQYQVVVLANVARLNDQQVRDLEQFVYGGGGLLIAPGNLARVDNYNAALYRGGTGIMPAELSEPTPADGSRATALLGLDLNHPVFLFLKGRPDPVPSATIGRYFPAAARSPDARVLASYVSGQPFLIESTAGRTGRGRVMLVTTPLDADWNTLPLSNFYLPFVDSVARYLAAGASGERNLAPGQPLVATFEQTMTSKATIQLPDGKKHGVDVMRVGDRYEARFAATGAPGVYILRAHREAGKKSEEVKLQYVVQAPREESDLTALTNSQWEDLSAQMGFEVIDPATGSVSAALAAARSGKELWLSLIGVVVALGVGELVVERFWVSEG
jgi:hypothetical protein